MATNITLTRREDRSGKYVAGSITGSGASVVLDTAADNTAEFISNGYKQHDYQYEVAAIGTNVTCALQVRLAPGGTWVTRATKQTTANGNDVVSFTGYAYSTRLVLTTITGGTPNVRNISTASSDAYSR